MPRGRLTIHAEPILATTVLFGSVTTTVGNAQHRLINPHAHGARQSGLSARR
ncbi:hypothetical protein OG883_15255 [Streptomyces sp. NBC_01142]|uniref:hypothetical protein n=1 Tax=Streptomyces sp. NBC_01142 TaxID=2975865 RepID=UPI00224F51E4|nr:hypothetical protein [Streptomyces sp. NBC_01142]MCX4821244.1 hypothetical protein [Streptomyces sp. NBC_01142]